MRRNLYGARRTAVGIVFGSVLPFEIWATELRVAARSYSTSRWQIGDLLIHGEQADFGATYDDAIEKTGLSYQALANIKTVCKRFKISRRRENLSFGHHAEVVSLQDREQDRLLDLAAAACWSRNTLREEVTKLREGIIPDNHEPALPLQRGTPVPSTPPPVMPERSTLSPTQALAVTNLTKIYDQLAAWLDRSLLELKLDEVCLAKELRDKLARRLSAMQTHSAPEEQPAKATLH